MKQNKKEFKITPQDPIPQLLCIKKPTKGKNDGVYSVKIPLKHMVSAYENPAAFFVFNFIGIKESL